MATIVQSENRLLSVTSTLGTDVLLLAGFSGHEELSRLYTYDLDLLSENEAIPAKDIVGKPVGWAVTHMNDEPRYFHGIVKRFVAGARKYRQYRGYKAEIVPWPWFLTRTADCKIFQNKTAPEIIEQVFK